MAGSIKWFLYADDGDTVYALKADESNVEALMGSTNDYLADSGIRFALPSNLKPRTAVYANAARTRTIRIPVLTTTVFAALPTDHATITDPIAGTGNLSLIQLIPERITLLPSGDDTGLTDGDAT